MSPYFRLMTAACLCAILPLLAGCPAEAVTPAPNGGAADGGTGIAGNGDDAGNGIVGPPAPPQTLPPNEADAIRAVLDATVQLTQAVITAQAAINTGDGACPTVTTTGTTSSLSFGGGCTVTTAPEFVCAGNALGSQTDEITGPAPSGLLVLTLQGVSCVSNPPVSGAVDAVFLAGPQTDLNGTWNLNYPRDGIDTNLTGNGNLQYDASRRFVNIVRFNGQVSADGAPLTISLQGLVLSRTVANSSIPFAGTATVTSPEIRELGLGFDADSPATGEILVSAGNGAPFVVDIDRL
jgi:hypothetical protein